MPLETYLISHKEARQIPQIRKQSNIRWIWRCRTTKTQESMLWGQQWSKLWSLSTATWRDWGQDLWVRLRQCKDKRKASSDLCFGATWETGLLLQETHPIYLGPKSYSCYKTRQLDRNQNWQSMTLGDLEGQRLKSVIMARQLSPKLNNMGDCPQGKTVFSICPDLENVSRVGKDWPYLKALSKPGCPIYL